MRFSCVPLAMLAGIAWSQSASGTLGSRAASRIAVEPSLRADPPSAPLAAKFTATARIREMLDGRTFYTRILLDRVQHVYLGYELLLEQQPSGGYLATFGKLGVTTLDISSSGLARFPRDPLAATPVRAAWTMLPLPAIPEPRAIAEGGSISLDLLVDAATGAKLIDDIHLVLLHPLSRPVPQPPTVSGAARDFTAADAELQLLQPRLTLNGEAQTASGPASVRNVRGALVWLYFPDHGRYILSLVPRAELGFRKAGEVRGGILSFTLDDDSIRLQCMSAIATGYAPYNLYVLHDADWQPLSERQKDWPASGSISADELAALRRK